MYDTKVEITEAEPEEDEECTSDDVILVESDTSLIEKLFGDEEDDE